ncbi:glutamate-tRNA ligase [Hysterangium stoloniferum]|nr:glutamate-tRNA ligase [Hysterangium stoloniferum]
MSFRLTFNPGVSPFPFAPLVLATRLQGEGKRDVEICFDSSVKGVALDLKGGQVTEVNTITSLMGKELGYHSDNSTAAGFFSLAESLPTITGFADLVAALDFIDDHLVLRSFMIGHNISVVDWAAAGLLKNNHHSHLSRWYTHIESFESTQDAIAKLAEARSNKAKANKTAGSFALGLPDAIDGQVVTRFPPEPSGYLHIGHSKAAMLNQYFAKMYNGKLIIRFDDTNPSKEKAEFEETILEDLTLLEIIGDHVTHTSDYFDHLYEHAIKMIRSGNAYADDTEQMKMRQERMDGIASIRRDATIEENLARFAEMTTGSTEGQRWCIRAKISVDNPNKALRDPVIYRCNILPHHRTGLKWKVYPTYDFACPLVDSIEGVTHALRTNEYRDRNPQYFWMIDTLELRKPVVWDFSRLNFIYTLLSKRKLRWFVEEKLVRGWDDPRFPTVRGIRRRGLTVEALRQYMLAQGPSQAVVSLEWDSIWSMNKKVIDPIAPRFWAVEKNDLVQLTLTGSVPVEVKQNPKHKKNPEIGVKDTVYGSVIFVEQVDALSFTDNEEITLMDWGNAIVRSKTVSSSGAVEFLTADLNLDGDFRKTEKKITWLADPAAADPARPLVDVTLLDYDYLITKKKLEEEDDVANLVTPITEFRVEAWADPNVKDLIVGDIIQFERKGYYRLDSVRGTSSDLHMDFIHIPDGRAVGLASKSIPASETSKPKEKKKKTKSSVDAVEGETVLLSNASSGFTIPVTTAMYNVSRVYGEDALNPISDAKMYPVTNVYDSTS